MKPQKWCLFFLLIILFLIIFLIIPIKKTLENEIYSYSLTNQSVNISKITDFKWDVAYLDYEAYGVGSELKNKHSLKGDFKMLESDFLYRIAFYDHNELVYDCILNESYIIFDSTIDKFTSKTKFVVNVINNSYNNKVVYLSIDE